VDFVPAPESTQYETAVQRAEQFIIDGFVRELPPNISAPVVHIIKVRVLFGACMCCMCVCVCCGACSLTPHTHAAGTPCPRMPNAHPCARACVRAHHAHSHHDTPERDGHRERGARAVQEGG
jgi:hypothetical protein